MTARIRWPEGKHLLVAIAARRDTVFGIAENHVGKTWVPIHRNPAGVRVVAGGES